MKCSNGYRMKLVLIGIVAVIILGGGSAIADSVEGCLMTQLKSGRSSAPLSSQTCITDGAWHRIAFVWDGSQRHLYVDGLVVAEDTTPQSILDGGEGDLYFGAGSDLTPGTYWSGLIDDIRIYNRVVSP